MNEPTPPPPDAVPIIARMETVEGVTVLRILPHGTGYLVACRIDSDEAFPFRLLTTNDGDSVKLLLMCGNRFTVDAAFENELKPASVEQEAA